MPNIFKWNLININDISYLFDGCTSLNTEMIKYKFKNLNKNMDLYSSLLLNNDKYLLYYSMEQVEDKIKIFGSIFVKNNRNKCKIIFNNKKYELQEELDINDLDIDVFSIIIVGVNNISDFSYMFHECDNLIKIEILNDDDIDDILDDNIYSANENMEDLIPVINNHNIINDIVCGISIKDSSESFKEKKGNIINMSKMFYGCTLLKSIEVNPEYETNNIVDISYMFAQCENLKVFPDISKWNTSNIKDMSYLFQDCKNLISFPDISKWDTSSVKYLSGLFSGCNNCLSIPDISK
jgi:surface protein